jgi:protein TonB
MMKRLALFAKQFTTTTEPSSVLSKNSALSAHFLASVLIHIAAILLIAMSVNRSRRLLQQNLIPIAVIDAPAERDNFPRKEAAPPEVRKPPPSAPREIEKALVKHETAQPERSAPLALDLPKDEATKPMETKPDIAPEPAPARTAAVEGGGSEAGSGNLFGKSEAGLLPGAGTGGGGGTAAAGLGRGSGAPGLPTAGTALRTNRQAKAIQTVQPSYPPMALRMGLEGDVMLKIEVDTDGKVTKAEVLKSAGGGFDEAAMKAVKQSRFEPAQEDGQTVLAEFTYIYRFRLTR